jgi:hypothetical protein
MPRLLYFLTIALVISACSAAPGADSSAATPVTAGTASTLLANGPVTDWDHPFLKEGVTVNASVLAAAPANYGLSFAPDLPAFATGHLRWTDISTHATVAYMFDFSGDPRFGSDARVEVQESKATMTEAEFAGVKWSGTYSTTHVGTTLVVLRQYDGVGDILFIKNGRLFEVFGPALSPDVALQLGKDLAAQLP